MMDFANYLPPNSLTTNLEILIDHLLKQSIGTIIDDMYDDLRIRIFDFTTGRPCIDYCAPSMPRTKEVADRFKIAIPFAGKIINWDVVFNSLSPDDPPDFNFNDDNFTRTIDANSLEKFVPSLNNWKSDDPASLKNVITEFISFYKKYHLEQLKEDNYCWFEYLSILKTKLIDENDVEVLVTNSGLINFLIRLCPDLTDYKLPHPHDHYAAHIVVCFCTNAGSSKMSKPQAKLTPFLKECLAFKQSFNECFDSSTLAEFIVKLNEKIEDSLSPIFLKPIAKRKRFIFEWLSCFGRKVVEFDAINFLSVSFLYERDGFFCILSIHLSKDFTAVPPHYKLQSVYSQTPVVVQVVPVSYSPSWSFKAMMTKAVTDVDAKIDAFRKFCISHISVN